ncbi:MAG TPA: phage holin family protein [Thermoleophilaceae bacterium]|nr:phage holin family protein [Thermoleophilaceae bacterium]
MTDGGARPATDADKSLSDILGEVSRTSSLLVRQEIELAKAELTVKAKRLGGGAAAAAIAGVFAVLALIFLLQGLAWFFADLIGGTGLLQIWLGFLITAGVLLVLGAIAGLLALRYFRRGLPPTPQLAIDEAKKTRAAIEEVSAR